MPRFLRENILFLISLGLLGTLVASASELQITHGTRETPRPPAQTIAAGEWHIASTSISSAPQAAITTSAAPPQPVPSPARVPVRHRVYHGGE